MKKSIGALSSITNYLKATTMKLAMMFILVASIVMPQSISATVEADGLTNSKFAEPSLSDDVANLNPYSINGLQPIRYIIIVRSMPLCVFEPILSGDGKNRQAPFPKACELSETDTKGGQQMPRSKNLDFRFQKISIGNCLI